MKTCYLDSNLLVYYKNEDAPSHKKSLEILAGLRKEGYTFGISPLVLDEFLYVFAFILRQKRAKDTFSQLENALKDILDIPTIKLVSPPLDGNNQQKVPQLMRKYKLSPRDSYHLLTMQTNEIDSFATFDNDFETVFAAGLLENLVAR